ncbi:MAG: substrate-binding domain-containing protein [Gammaproteobacteria bacterium]|nr:substrate-binding domain-containing protein [Gammaproteobacteria bacterium]
MNLKELSEHLSLSPTTVSRALNGYPEVSEQTRLRVTEAAKRLQYQPSQSARRLATGRSNTIGHVIPRSQQNILGPHFADIMAGVTDASSQAGYESLLSIVEDDEEESFYRQMIASKRVDGVVLHGPRVNDTRIELLIELEVPFVVHGRSDVAPEYAWMDVNNRRALQRATEFLLDLGHQSIGFLNGTEHMFYAVRRRLGFEAAFAERGLTADTSLMFSNELTDSYGFEFTTALLNRKKPPTALVVSGILPAYGALRAATQVGLRVPEDLSIITYDDQLSYLPNDGDIPLFTALRSSIRDAGKRVIELLVQNIEMSDMTMTNELWEAELVVGRSTGRPAR